MADTRGFTRCRTATSPAPPARKLASQDASLHLLVGHPSIMPSEHHIFACIVLSASPHPCPVGGGGEATLPGGLGSVHTRLTNWTDGPVGRHRVRDAVRVVPRVLQANWRTGGTGRAERTHLDQGVCPRIGVRRRPGPRRVQGHLALRAVPRARAPGHGLLRAAPGACTPCPPPYEVGAHSLPITVLALVSRGPTGRRQRERSSPARSHRGQFCFTRVLENPCGWQCEAPKWMDL